MEIVTRKEAQSQGLKLFFTGKPCARGHVAQRYTSCDYCTKCAADNRKRWAKENPQKKKQNTKDWYTNNKEKVIERAAAWKKNNPERNRQLCAQWRENNPEKIRALHLRSKYNLTTTQFDQMVVSQDNACAICGNSFGSKTPHIDHCHTTGKVRGLLCGPCNRALGLMKDDVSILTRAIQYLDT